jgi:UDP-N-acetylmuramoyl-tripeptide--D-alanyl-D-alanine ligase
MPLSLLGMREADYFVAELGISQRGEMRPLSEAMRPHVAVLTNIGAAHLGNFESLNALAAEKACLAAGQSAEDVLLTGEEIPRALFARYAPHVLHVGLGKEADIRALSVRMDGSGVRADVRCRERIVKGLFWPIPGRIGLSTLLFSAAVGILEGKSADTIRAGVQRAWSVLPRMRILQESGRILIDDTYNASPEAVISAVETAMLLAEGRPVGVVLGDMLELGRFSEEYHRFVGQCIAAKGIKYLFLLGKYAPYTAEGARLGGMATDAIFCFAEGEGRELSSWVADYTPKNGVLLFKASRKLAFEEVFEAVRRKL